MHTVIKFKNTLFGLKYCNRKQQHECPCHYTCISKFKNNTLQFENNTSRVLINLGSTLSK